MNETNTVVESYRHADFGTRLYMFMEHRDLRAIFDEIEAEEYPAFARAGSQEQATVLARWRAGLVPLRQLLNGCCNRWV